jgi:hypothetical protein
MSQQRTPAVAINFRFLENISKATYYELKKRGLTPDEINVGGLARITPEARTRWHERMAELAKSKAAQLEAQRPAAVLGVRVADRASRAA